jgi:hypothetical protein
VVAPGALELLDDLSPLREEAPRLLSAGEHERAEHELVAQAARADHLPVRGHAPEREREEERKGPAEARGHPTSAVSRAQKSGNATMLERSRIVA